MRLCYVRKFIRKIQLRSYVQLRLLCKAVVLEVTINKVYKFLIKLPANEILTNNKTRDFPFR